jgi:hypothetical protein
MRRAGVLLFVAALGLFCAGPGGAGPIHGDAQLRRRVEAKGVVTITKEDRQLGHLLKFKGGERACVVVMGDHKPVVPDVLDIRDDQGRLIGRDEPARGVGAPNALGNDVAAVIWYPPRDGYYRITIESHGVEYNDVYIALR